MSDEKEKDTIRKLCGEMAWEHFDQNADPPVELWRVDMERRFVGRQIRQSNWFASKQAADDYARVQTERGSVLMSIVEYHADPAAEIAGLRADLQECRTYHQPRIAELERLNLEAQHRIADLIVLVGNLEQCRVVEGDSITILCDNPEADSAENQSAVEACGGYTDYQLQRFYGKTWEEALKKAAACARRYYSDDDKGE